MHFISPDNFYSPKLSFVETARLSERELSNLEWLARIRHARSHALNVMRHTPPDTSQSYGIWRIFPKLQWAIEFAQNHSEDLHVFVFETYLPTRNISEDESSLESTIDDTKRIIRRFLATSYTEFWHRYRQMSDEQRSFYEVILPDSPCRLYFDLEYSVEDNPNANSDIIMSTFISYLQELILQRFGIILKNEHIIDLESSTAKKFSRHLILHLDAAVFASNDHCGRFVSYLKDRISREMDMETEKSKSLSCLFVKNNHQQQVLFIDDGVYTRNRNFRLWKSSKLGKDAFLNSSTTNSFPCTSDELFFYDSLVCCVNYTSTTRILTIDDGSLSKYSSYSSETVHQPSPFPEIDRYIIRTWDTKVKANGKACIRSSSYFQSGKIIVYAIVGNRYCDNIQREHRSNNITLIADLNRGAFYQRCLDPDCRREKFQSSDFWLPCDLMPFNDTLVTDIEGIEDIEHLPPDDILFEP